MLAWRPPPHQVAVEDAQGDRGQQPRRRLRQRRHSLFLLFRGCRPTLHVQKLDTASHYARAHRAYPARCADGRGHTSGGGTPARVRSPIHSRAACMSARRGRTSGWEARWSGAKKAGADDSRSSTCSRAAPPPRTRITRVQDKTASREGRAGVQGRRGGEMSYQVRRHGEKLGAVAAQRTAVPPHPTSHASASPPSALLLQHPAFSTRARANRSRGRQS